MLPALASSMSVTGPEIAYGAVHGKAATANNPVIPLKWRGLVHAHGVFSRTAPPRRRASTTRSPPRRGNLAVVVIAKPTNTQSFNVKACHFAFTTRVVFAALPGKSTGKFTGATGHGVVVVYFAGFGPRFTSGPRRASDRPARTRRTAERRFASFLLKAVLTLPSGYA